MFVLNDRKLRNVLLQCDHGAMIINRFDCNFESVGHGQWLLDHGNVSTSEVSMCYAALGNKDNPVIFDVGANIGTWLTWMARALPSARFLAFEPQQAVFQMLCGNLAINNIYNVYAYPFALGDQCGQLSVYEPDYFEFQDFGTFSLEDPTKHTKTKTQLTIEIRTVDSMLGHSGIHAVDLIKIDAEGMDLRVLQGAVKCIEQSRPVIYIEHCDNQKTILDDIKAFLGPWGYRFHLDKNNVLCTC